MDVPVYALVLAVLLPTVYTLPSGFIFAMTSQGVRVRIKSLISSRLSCRFIVRSQSIY